MVYGKFYLVSLETLSDLIYSKLPIYQTPNVFALCSEANGNQIESNNPLLSNAIGQVLLWRYFGLEPRISQHANLKKLKAVDWNEIQISMYQLNFENH